MKKTSRVIIALLIIVVIIALSISYTIYDDFKKEETLISEINKIAKTDFILEKINTKIITEGDYGTVEKTIKTYLNNYSEAANKITDEIKDITLNNVFTIDNMIKEGKEFKETKETLKAISELELKIDNFVNKSKKEYIEKQIKNKNLDTYYVNLYKNLIFDENIKMQLDNNSKQIHNSWKKLKSTADSVEKIIEFLEKEKENWEIINNQLYFKTQELTDQYNEKITLFKEN